ncbi:SCF E3 ubiquitin ligase complex F-box protein grrA-like [Trifolium pratense]|uniref:SCF E3 ubiquitin ligase complex F-box protein grrA-like n=1 Tax=Trifolium pratense TaxID=57577 RepID=UPI001E691A8B|nr:SCF E3 ubiquitin ligase complex F-box protein grrA-like [Trifolium pratense]
MASSTSSSRKRMAGGDGLTNDCWELVISKLEKEKKEEEESNHCLETLSMVSKQLLSISSSFVHSIKLIHNPSSSPISRLFHRFTNLTSLDLSAFRGGGDINALLSRIPPTSVSRLTSLNLSNQQTFPILGLRSILLKNCRLTSLICSNIAFLKFTDITFIADSFPFLQHLDLSFPRGGEGILVVEDDYNNAMNLLPQKLKLLRSVNLSGNFYINNSSFLQLCINCEFLQEVLISRCPFITHAGIAEAIHHRPTLNSLSVTNFKEGLELENVDSYFIDSLTSLNRLTCLDFSFSCITDLMLKAIALHALPLTKLVLQDSYNYTYSGISHLLSKCPSLQHLDLQRANFLNDKLFNHLCAFLPGLLSINVSSCDKLTNSSFFALLTNCPLLSEIRMESTDIGLGPTPSIVDLLVYPQLKSLHLAYNSHLQDHHINNFASMFPNMQLIDLSFCHHIFQHRIAVLLKRCPKITHFKFVGFPHAKLRSINSEASILEVLNLAHSRIDDEGLYQISKTCPQLLQLDLEHCHNVTEKGVQLAVENCTRLREINLQHCHKVSTDIVSQMIFTRPSLRKIIAPPHFHPRDCDRKLLFERCLVF